MNPVDLSDLNKFGSNIAYSQAGEEGILLELLKRLDMEHNGIYLDLGAGGGYSNTRYLAENYGWTGLGIDGGGGHNVLSLWITAENVNQIVGEHLHGVPNLFSLDLDGNDWWIWKALTIRPEIVIVEINASIPNNFPLTMPYNADHKFDDTEYHGANYEAFRQLGESKGYVPVCCTMDLNVFFVLKELVAQPYPNIQVNRRHRLPPDTLKRQFVRAVI